MTIANPASNATTLQSAGRMILATIMTMCLILLTGAPQALAQDQTSDTAPRAINPPAMNVPASAAVQSNDANADDDDDDAQSDSRWPMRLTIPQGELTVYQPQLTDFQNNTMTGRAAVSILTPDSKDPVFGAIWLVSRVMTDRAARTVKVIDIKVDRIRIPTVDNLPQEALGKALTQAFERDPMNLTLDQLIAMVERVKEDTQAVKGLSDAPPKIVFINNPAVLLQFDGEPRFVQSKQPELLQAVNTPFFVVLDKQIKRYYLKGAGHWFIARNVIGPYLALDNVPAYVTTLAKDTGYVDPEADLAQAQRDQKIDTPAIIVATEPTELVWTLGPEELSPIQDTNLLYVTNTDSDIILDIDSQKIYLLLAGRWYRSDTRSGPWEYVEPDKMPADFARIPSTSDKGSVLAHVAGTQMAKDALADNYVPQTASIDRNNYEQPTVTYDGEPRFENIQTTGMTYAVNTPNAVVFAQGRYYVCYDAVWYQSNFATGPWELSISVPAEIYRIPPTNPIYAVRYVRIYDVTPTVIYTGYLPGYVGSYVHQGVVVYGTGYHYRSWAGNYYYPRPYTWGFSPRYDPYHSYWGFDVGVQVNFGSGLSLWFGSSNRYVPARSTWFGYGGYRPVYIHRPQYNNRWNNYRYNQGDRRTNITINNNIVNNNYRDARDRVARQPSPRRADLNLYERRHDVIETRTQGKSVLDRSQRAQRIDRNQTDRLSASGQRVDRNNNDKADANEQTRRPQTTNNSPTDSRNDARPVVKQDATPNTRNDARSDSRRASDNRSDDSRTRTRRLNADRDNTSGNQRELNNVFADEKGDVYRKTIDGWERRDRNQWVHSTNPTPVNTNRSNRAIITNNGRADSNHQADTSSREVSNSRSDSNRRATSSVITRNPAAVVEDPRTNSRGSATPSDRGNSASRSTGAEATSGRSRSSSPAVLDTNISASRRAKISPPQHQSGDRSTDSSLNADYRARIMGDQRRRIYNQDADVRAQQPQQPQQPQRQQRQTPPAASSSDRDNSRSSDNATSRTSNQRSNSNAQHAPGSDTSRDASQNNRRSSDSSKDSGSSRGSRGGSNKD